MSQKVTSYNPAFSYHYQRTFWPLLAGFTAFLLWHNECMPGDNAAVPAFASYVIAGLFYDWLIFNYLKYKDSRKYTEEQWAMSNIKAHEVDKLNEFYVMVRRCAFAASISTTSACSMFFPQMSIMGSFFFAYAGVTIFLITIGVLTKEIIFKYTPKNVLAPTRECPPGGMYTPTGPLIDPSGSVININR